MKTGKIDVSVGNSIWVEVKSSEITDNIYEKAKKSIRDALSFLAKKIEEEDSLPSSCVIEVYGISFEKIGDNEYLVKIKLLVEKTLKRSYTSWDH